MNSSKLYLFISAITLSSYLIACGSFGPLLSDVQVRPNAITPNADGVVDVTRISYHLARSANLSIYLVDDDEQRYYFRQNRRRSEGDYAVHFGGVIDGSMLPDGSYSWVVEATADDGETMRQSGSLTISEADTTKPELQGFSVYPETFTPNQDGINDRVTINYYLTKAAKVLVYLLPPDGTTKYPIVEVERELPPGEPGFHTYDYEGGVDLGADPPPDGEYTVYAEAEDRVGNRTIITQTLVITEGGVPRADIVGATVSFYNPETDTPFVPLGQTLAFTLTVENFGSVPIRTIGPSSGEAYQSEENFNTKGFYESAGVWRVGIDYEGNPAYAYPYRWSIGNLDELETRVINQETFYYLMPGQRALVHGSIQLNQAPASRDRVTFWAGLIHEMVRIEAFNNRVDPQPIVIGF